MEGYKELFCPFCKEDCGTRFYYRNNKDKFVPLTMRSPVNFPKDKLDWHREKFINLYSDIKELVILNKKYQEDLNNNTK